MTDTTVSDILTRFNIPQEELSHSEAFVQNFISGDVKHYGVKGMKWGVRKKSSSSSSSSGSKSSPGKPKRSAKDMTDKELQDFLRRVDLERKYNAIVNPPSRGQKARKFVAETLTNSGKQIAASYAQKGMAHLVDKGLKAAIAAQKK